MAGLFRRLTAGVYVVGVADGDRRNTFTAAWVTQTSFRPLCLAVAVSPGHASYPLLRSGGVFSVSVLAAGRLGLARHLGTTSGRDADKLAGVAWWPGRTGTPVLAEAAAYFECRVVADVEAGDHRLVIGRVAGGAVLDSTARPLTYAETGDLDGSAEALPGRLLTPDEGEGASGCEHKGACRW